MTDVLCSVSTVGFSSDLLLDSVAIPDPSVKGGLLQFLIIIPFN